MNALPSGRKGRAGRTLRIVSRSAASEIGRTVRSRSRRDTDAEILDGRERRARELRATLERLGPLYVKVGQILATRPDLVPQYVMDELEELNDRANVEPFSSYERVLCEELGDDWRSRFREVHTQEPLGAASLAQVYKAVTADGRPCVLKIQRPGSSQAVLGDMKVLRTVARLLARAAPRFSEVVDVKAMLELLFVVMEDELDFTREAKNMKDARKVAKGYSRIRVPRVIEATPRVLVQTFAEGVPINRVKPDSFSRRQRKKIANQMISYMFRSYFVERTFHADLHPGNIIISPDGKAHLIDWGMLGKMDRDTSVSMLGVFLSLAQNDGVAMGRNWVQLGTATPWSNVSAFIGDMSRVVPRWADASLTELNYGVALMTLMKHSSAHGIQITPLVSVMGKSVANLEGSLRCIHPKLKFAAALRDTLPDIMRDVVLDSLSTEQGAQLTLSGLKALSNLPGQFQATAKDMADRQVGLQVRTNLGDPIKAGSRHRLAGGEHIRRTALSAIAALATRKRYR
ncbi:ABC1 kinase family protein [Streptomyces sp. NPDC020707]|uniref:AarF/UbiB family protein n=1 Tax=Streptomyces ortus TaxID=2867268 RepID=A0ABT3VJL1_9ACTN|nr:MULTISPECIES: AarF/UbiB family protein [Streptomyces]MCX4238860.1 AarF/UbiB family protein [Streptomyces ortus]